MIIVNGYQLDVVRFPNAEVTIKLNKNALAKKEKHVVWRFESNEDIVLLKLLESYILENDYLQTDRGFSTVLCEIAYMPYSRMDRSEGGSPFSLDMIASILPKHWNYKVWETHSSATAGLLRKHTYGLVTEEYYTKRLLSETIFKLYREFAAKMVLVYPDKGAAQRYSKEMLGYHDDAFQAVLVGEKIRDFETGDIKGLEFKLHSGSMDGVTHFSAVIVDDLSSYGGTFVRSAKELTKMGAVNIHLVTGHAEESAFKGELMDYLDSFRTTDSMNHGFSTDPRVTIQSIHQWISPGERRSNYEKFREPGMISTCPTVSLK